MKSPKAAAWTHSRGNKARERGRDWFPVSRQLRHPQQSNHALERLGMSSENSYIARYVSVFGLQTREVNYLHFTHAFVKSIADMWTRCPLTLSSAPLYTPWHSLSLPHAVGLRWRQCWWGKTRRLPWRPRDDGRSTGVRNALIAAAIPQSVPSSLEINLLISGHQLSLPITLQALWRAPRSSCISVMIPLTSVRATMLIWNWVRYDWLSKWTDN